MKNIPSKIIWAGMPGTLCNLSCEYCYIQSVKRGKGKTIHSLEHILKSFSPERFGGPVYFNGTGSGETLLWNRIIDFTEGMLSYGHMVSYNTNLTVTPSIKKLCALPRDYRAKLLLLASWHYLELRKKKLLDTFFDNLRMLKSAEISYAILLCITNDYIPFLREISELCQKETGILPIAAMERQYSRRGAKTAVTYTLETEKLIEETCDTRYWKFQKKVFGHKRTEFCHAGEMSITMNLTTGNYQQCWGIDESVSWQGNLLRKIPFIKIKSGMFMKSKEIMGNMFNNPNKPIIFKPIGSCPFYDCVCPEYLFFGPIPEFEGGTCSEIFLKPSVVSKKVWEFMNYKIVT